jgi:hypothetical protein
MKLHKDTPLKRKGKPKPNVLEEHDEYLTVTNMIRQNKMKPGQQVGISFGPDDMRLLEQKWPWRTAADRLKKLLKQLHLQADYRVVKYETDMPGIWYVKVTRQPQETAQGDGNRRKKKTEAGDGSSLQ